MSFWDDLNPSVKRYIIVAVVLLVALLAFRMCASPESAGSGPPPRGMAR